MFLLGALVGLAKGAAADTLSASAHYECLWWSAYQQAHFNPNHPPPQETRIQLDHWEYSDPVGVPHPDTIILVVTLISTSLTTPVTISVTTRWLGGGPEKGETMSSNNIRLRAGVAKTIEFLIPVKSKIYESNPKLLRSSVWSGHKELTHADLPIVIGD